jgi:type IV secretion system protein VirB10
MNDVPDMHSPEAPRAAAVVERGISPIAGRLGSGLRGKGVVFAALVAGCGVFLVASWGRGAPAGDKAPVQPARQVVAFEPARRPAPTLADPGAAAPRLTTDVGPVVPAIEPGASASAGDGDRRRAELAAVRGAPILAFSRGGQGGASDVRDEAAADPGTELDQLRQASRIGLARAARLPDRNFLIVAGSAIPCLLQTAIDSTTPGYVSCLIPRDVYSDNGAVVLMEKGTRVLGEYRSGMRQGQRRLFVLWTRAVTPGGVAVSLASPAADSLGRAGFDGEIDSHFWDRFGGALLLSVVDDGAYAIAGRDNSYKTARLPSDAAGLALQNSVNIPPSLRKAQGAEVSIFVAQDFDFSGVYGLKAR